MRRVAGAPTTELGRLAPDALPGWSTYVDQVEDLNPLWSSRIESVRTVELMLTDSQCDGLRSAIQLPILSRTFGLYPNGAPAAVVERLAGDYGLPVLKRRGQKGGYELDGEVPDIPSTRGRFSFREHLVEALEAPFLGHYFFEQVYTPPAAPGGKARIRKLASRPPSAVTELNRASDGGLESIRMTYGRDAFGRPEPIPVDRLVAYVWGRRGANWMGRSMFRSIYRDWLLKDRNLRVLGMRNQRAGMGLPVYENPPGTSDAKIAENLAIPRMLQAGEDAGLSTPNGARLHLQGVEGTLPDILSDIKYADESMARRFLAMVIMLGQTQTGSRALGETLGGIYGMGIDSIAQWFCDTFSDHVLEDDVDWNDGEADVVPYRPRLAWASSNEDDDKSVTELVGLIDSGAIQVDTDVENTLRTRHNLPLRASERALTVPPPPEIPTGPEVMAALRGGGRRTRPDGGWG